MQKTRCVKMPAFDIKYHRRSEWQQIFNTATNRWSSRHSCFPWQWWSRDKLYISNVWNPFFIQTDRVLHPEISQLSSNVGGIDRNCTLLPPTHLWLCSGPTTKLLYYWIQSHTGHLLFHRCLTAFPHSLWVWCFGFQLQAVGAETFTWEHLNCYLPSVWPYFLVNAPTTSITTSMWRSLFYGLLKLYCMSILLPCVGFAKNQVFERRNGARSFIITYSMSFQRCFLWVDRWESMFLRRTKSVEVLQEAPRQAELIMYQRTKCDIFGEQTFYHQAAVWENCGS